MSGRRRGRRPSRVLTRTEGSCGAVAACESFDLREPGRLKVELDPAA